uniref:Rho GTPase activating protein 22 n=1 Tax=Myripristis murdjan TaxID=586833 RepID=A0A667YJY5_9TELE
LSLSLPLSLSLSLSLSLPPSLSMVLGELSRVSRPCSPLDQERALKAGWLKRQRSIMKNWQLRWFVLRTEALYFYKDQDETKAQVILIFYPGVKKKKKKKNQTRQFVISGGSGEKDRTGISHESFLLMASSQSDMEEWVRAIRRAVCCVVTGVFGQHLEETMLCENQCGPQRPVPVLVEQCVCFIRQRGLEEEGLFRAPGQTNHVRELQDAFDRGEKPVLDSTTDVHTVASLLKLYIRELPEPVIPFSKYTQFLSCAQLLLKDKEMASESLSYPEVDFSLAVKLFFLCRVRFLDEVQSHSNENKMSVQNLATVFGPNILRPRVEDPVTMMEGSSHVQHLMTVLISEHARLYQREEPETETKTATQLPQSPGQRCKVEWVSQEDAAPQQCLSSGSCSKPPEEDLQSNTPLTESKQFEPSPHSAPEKGEDSQTEGRGKAKTEGKVDGKMEGKSEGKAGSGAALSPSKQSKALPSWRCSFKGGAGSGGTRGKMGGSAGDVSTAGGSNWLMNELISCHCSSIDQSKSENNMTTSELLSRVSRLEEELDQEKKKFQMLEIRLRNSERAHQDAENRNVLLQKEMEEFFKTLGDLTTGTARTD